MLRRRKFLATFGAALLALPLARVVMRRRRRRTTDDLSSVPWIGHC
jgi:hypothetical protein